jgi:Tfp pilus assembly protein PilN
VRQEQISFYAAEDAIKKITDLEAAHALLTREIADYKAQNTEARMLKERLEELEARHVGMQEQIDRGNILNARLIQVSSRSVYLSWHHEDDVLL